MFHVEQIKSHSSNGVFRVNAQIDSQSARMFHVEQIKSHSSNRGVSRERTNRLSIRVMFHVEHNHNDVTEIVPRGTRNLSEFAVPDVPRGTHNLSEFAAPDVPRGTKKEDVMRPPWFCAVL